MTRRTAHKYTRLPTTQPSLNIMIDSAGQFPCPQNGILLYQTVFVDYTTIDGSALDRCIEDVVLLSYRRFGNSTVKPQTHS